MADEVHVNDIGTVLRGTFRDGGTVVPINGATKKEIWILAPKGKGPNLWAKKTGSFPSGEDGTNGELEYVVEDGDLPVAGTYKVQGYVELPGPPASRFHSDVHDLEVFPNVAPD